MQLSHTTRTMVLILSIGFCAYGLPPQIPEIKGIPPRRAPTDYQFHTQAGKVTIAAEFTGHSLPTLEGPLTTEDYIAVEAALFGPAGAKLTITASDFSLRVNGKKVLESEPYILMAQSLRDPEWAPPKVEKSKTSVLGGGDDQDSGPPKPVKVPLELQRKWSQRVRMASLPEGERPLPQDGLLFFKYRGKTEKLRSIELVYNGPAGKAAIQLQ